MSNFWNNYVKYCALNKVSPSAVAEEIGLSRTSPNGWKKGKEPRDVTLKKIADRFGITVQDLLKEDIEKEMPVTQLSDEQFEFLSLFNNARPESQKLALLALKDGQLPS